MNREVKDYIIYLDGFSLRIKFKNGGEIPEMLSGLFTRYHEAEKAITAYESQNRKVVQGKRKVIKAEFESPEGALVG